MARTTRAARNGGMTLVETLIAASVASILIGAVVHSLQAATGLFESTNAELEVDRRVRRMCQVLRSTIVNARGSSIDPALPEAPAGGPIPYLSDFELRSVTGWDVDEVVLGPTERIFARLDSAESDNGIDDDGDGLVDELEIVHLRDSDAASPIEVIIGRDILEFFPGETADLTDENRNGLVDEPGFSITENDGRVTVRLAAALSNDEGRLLVRTAQLELTTQP